MKIVVVGKTDATISLNKIGIPIKGREEAILNVDTEEKDRELRGLISAGLLEIVNKQSQTPIVPTSLTQNDNDNKVSNTADSDNKPKSKGGRPKGSKNKTAKTEQQRVIEAEEETQKMGGRVVVATGEGSREGKMRSSFAGEIADSEKTKESIEALKKLEEEEKEGIILPDRPVDEIKLDPSEQMGRKAVVSTQSGNESVDMVNSILPNAKEAKNRNPFIDKSEKSATDKEEKKDGNNEDGDDFSDAFIKM